MQLGKRGSIQSISTLHPIAEDEVFAPAIPPKSRRRSLFPGYQPSYPPPVYTTDSSEPDRTPTLSYKEGLRENEWFTRRGGWLRLTLLCLLLSLIIIGLAVGLTVGLQNQRDSPDSTVPEPDTLGPFPVGSYALLTFLTNITTACTVNPATWRCHPYQTYSSSPSSSSATFFWSITRSPDEANARYLISSSPNPFAPRFDNESLTHLDSGLPTERFTFRLGLAKTSAALGPLGDGAKTATCEFGTAELEGTLWTRMVPERVVSGDNQTKVGDGGKYSAWPGRVEVVQRARPQGGQPKCTELDGGQISEIGAGEGECLCRYANSDLEG